MYEPFWETVVFVPFSVFLSIRENVHSIGFAVGARSKAAFRSISGKKEAFGLLV